MSRKLHLGGQVKKNGWEVLNATPADYVDHLGNANNLSQFEDNTFDELYGSHILEHLDFKKELFDALEEWYRVLTPGGKLYAAVPDMDILCKLFLEKEQLDTKGRFMIMQMMFGAHSDEYDYHMIGLNHEFLHGYLNEVGFINIERVQSFNLFEDTSEMKFANVPISLNLIAEKPSA